MARRPYTYRAIVTRVIDADTVCAQVDLGFGFSFEHKFRLARINGPELNDPHPELRRKALEGKAFLAELVEFEEVVIETYKPDKYGRYLAEIWLDGRNVNTELVKLGLATEMH